MTHCENSPHAAYGQRCLDAAVAAAAAEVLALLVDRTEVLGRSGLIAYLGERARQAASSPLAEDRIRALAYAQAADDLVWGHAPLGTWHPFAHASPTAEQRRALAATLPAPSAARHRDAREAVARFESEGLRTAGSAFDGARGLPLRLARAVALQRALWDDPRLAASAEERALMRETLRALQDRQDQLAAILPWPRLEPKKPRRFGLFRRPAYGCV